MRIRIKSGQARFVTIREWQEKLALLDEIQRPTVLRIDEFRGLVKIRPKTYGEVIEAQKRAVVRNVRSGTFSVGKHGQMNG